MSTYDDFDHVDSIDDLPEHDTGRIHPGFNPNARQVLDDAVETIGEQCRHGRLRAFVAVSMTTVHVYSEDWDVAFRQAADNFSDGDLRSVVPNRPREIDDPDEDRLIQEYYFNDDEEWPCFAVDLVGGALFYTWARDQAQAAEVGLSYVDAGDHQTRAFLTDWRVSPSDVDARRIAVGRHSFKEMLQEAES